MSVRSNKVAAQGSHNHANIDQQHSKIKVAQKGAYAPSSKLSANSGRGISPNF